MRWTMNDVTKCHECGDLPPVTGRVGTSTIVSESEQKHCRRFDDPAAGIPEHGGPSTLVQLRR